MDYWGARFVGGTGNTKRLVLSCQYGDGWARAATVSGAALHGDAGPEAAFAMIAREMAESGDITTLLRAWGAGDESVSDELFQAVYSQLRLLARHHLRSRPGMTLTPTILINEAFLVLAEDPKNDWRDRVQFFAFTATVMRRLMSAHSRRRSTSKRGANAESIVFDEAAYPAFERGVDAARLDDALKGLEILNPAQARIVELRFFGGLSVGEVAAYLGVSERTVLRQWGLAKAWLAGELGAGETNGVAPS